MEYRNLTFEETEKHFNSTKRNNAAGYDDIDSNVILKTYDKVSYPLFMIFNSSINEDIFPKQLKIAKASPLFKIGNIEEVGNYRSISVFPTFSKLLERIIYFFFI